MSLDCSESSPHFVTRCGREFFDVPCQKLAKALLGQVVVRQVEAAVRRGRIVETEAYLGGEDMASHSHHGKITERTAPTFMAPGTVYVAPVYGMYSLFNISSQGDGASVLIRALEPISGVEDMKRKRSMFGANRKRKSGDKEEDPGKRLKSYKVHEVCNGPSKLAISLSILPAMSGEDLSTSSQLWIEPSCESVTESAIVECPRIGVDQAGRQWASKPLRFYILGNSSVSKRDKKAEEELMAVIRSN